MPVRRDTNEEGFTLIMVVIGLSLIALLALVAVTAVNGDAHLASRDLARKQAYEAAQAGLNEYAYHLHANSGYWAGCTEPTGATGPSALNQIGSTTNRRSVPGSTGATYAIELIPSTGHSKCEKTTLETATASMLEALEPMKGTFRIRSNGYAGETHVAITATFKPASFLDYVYFTQLETSDPVTYGSEEMIKAAERQCTKTIREGRYSTELKNEKGESLHKYCDAISFVHGDNIKGPMHTNDAFVICQNPTLGRGPTDPVEVSSPAPGWYSTKDPTLHTSSNCTGEPNFKGTFRTNSPVLIPPETNSELANIAEPAYSFEGEVSICLEGTKMTIGQGRSCTESAVQKSFPANGVIYVRNKSCLSSLYSPFNLAYPTTNSLCGNVNVSGTYSKPLTIAAANNILIKGNLEKSNEEGMLGLIANNFIRVYHPVTLETTKQFENGNWVEVTSCKGNAGGVLTNLKIEAAILAIKHSFIVDNYNCGSSLGTLNVKGAIAQKYRGAVGTSGGTGYLKNYEYDERLKTTEPPSFIEPIKSDWVIGRETTE
jgi:type II secretory pathway pseudopilin PulG